MRASGGETASMVDEGEPSISGVSSRGHAERQHASRLADIVTKGRHENPQWKAWSVGLLCLACVGLLCLACVGLLALGTTGIASQGTSVLKGRWVVRVKALKSSRNVGP